MKSASFWLQERASGDLLINEIDAAMVENVILQLGTDESRKIQISQTTARAVHLTNATHQLVGIATDSDHIKSKNIMLSEARILLASANKVNTAIVLAREKAESQTKRLIHNLKSLTAKTAQEIYLLARQDKLMESYRGSIKYLTKEIEENPESVAKALLSILKHQAAQKAEFSAFQKLNGEVGLLKPASHSVHKVLMNIFYLFFNDFTDKHVRIDVQATALEACFDYDSIHVCIYHIVENSAKYIKENSTMSVYAKDSGTDIEIFFDMESLAIKQKEVELIFKENYSGEFAIQNKLHGSGIGLYLARQMSVLNQGSLSVINGLQQGTGNEYARNKFTLTLPRTRTSGPSAQ